MRQLAVWLLFVAVISAQAKRPWVGRQDRVGRIQELERSLEAARETGKARAQGRALYDLGSAMKDYGDYGAATVHFEEAALQFSCAGAPRALARVLLNLGRVYWRQGRLDLALQAYRRALSIYQRLDDRSGMIIAYQEMGAASAMLGQQEEGLDLSRKALEMTGDAGAPAAVRRRQIGLALNYNEAGDHRRAAQIVEQVLAEFPRKPPPAAYWILSAAYFHLGMYEESLRAAGRGLNQTPGTSVEHSILARWWRARALDGLGRHEEAAGDMLATLDLVETVRARLSPWDSFKRGFAERSQPLAGDAIAVLWNAGRTRQALDVAERARARAFLDLLASRDSRGHSTSSSLLPHWEESEPNLPSASSSAPASVETVVELAARLDTHVLAYWVHPEAVYIWLVNPSGALHGERVVVREERLNHWIERVRRDAERPDREAWRQLFSVLIQPVRNRLPAEAGAELTILPHGALFQLPFAALTSQSGRYLIEDFALRTAPAAAFLDVRGPRNGAPRRYLLVGAPQTLPGARRELEGIASSGAPGQFTLLSGKNASRDRFLALAPDATVVHFATHAVVDPVQPFGSYLQLHGGSRLTAEEVYNLRLNADLVMLAACRSGSGKVSADGLLGLTRAFFYAGARSVIAPLWDVADQPTARLMTDFYREYQRDQRKVRALRAAQLRLLSDLRAGNVEVTTAAGPMILPEQPWLWAGFVLQGED